MIILIILSFVTISTFTGENGLINKVIGTRDDTEIDSLKEEILIDIMESEIANNGWITQEQLDDILKKYGDIVYEDDDKTIKALDTDKGEIDISDIISQAKIKKDIYVNHSILYCWDWEQTLPEYRTNFMGMCEELKITSVYLCFDPLNWTTNIEDTKSFIKELYYKDISVLALNGDPSWSYDINPIKNVLVDNVKKYNEKAREDEKILGIVLDIEPAGTSEWQISEPEAFKSYVETQIAAYNYTKQFNLMVMQCIPYWFDEVSVEQLEELVQNGCDGISVMNYWKDNTIELIRNEMQLAKKYNKYIDSIVELGEPNGDIIDANTFYNDGIEAAQENWKGIDNEYQYSKLGIAYHDYEAINKIQGKQYIIEVYLNYKDQKVPNTNITIVNVNRENVDIHTGTTTEGGYAVFRLDYGKTYRVEVEGYGIAGLTPDFTKKQFTFLIKEGDYFAIDAYIGENDKTTYNAEIYFKNQSSELITDKNVTIRNVNNPQEVYNATITSGGYISLYLKHGEEYEVSVEGYNVVTNARFKYDESIGSYKAFDVICEEL